MNTNVSANICRSFFPNLRKALTIAEHKRKWVDERVAELKATGLRNAAIARRMGVSPSWFSESMSNPTVSDKFLTALCQTFGLTFSTDETFGETEGQSEPPTPPDAITLRTASEHAVRVLPQLIERNLIQANLIDRLRAEVAELKAEIDRLRSATR